MFDVSATVSQGCVSFHRDGAGGSDEGQTAGDTNAPVPGSSTKSSQNNEEMSDHELDEYDLDNYDEEGYTGKKNVCQLCSVSEEPFHLLLYLRLLYPKVTLS